ncbi:MAG TPA: carboxypeptidase regulatory-like domain-containing protein [Vicinamibacterales bacterium]|nr:carboxypeptidase regulatory-like domain-containing protein [Vicinamibacterales bacterium]
MPRLIRVAVVLAVLLMPALALAQASITGVVRDSSGAVLPGVTVEASSPALIEKVRVVVTDGNGQYRFVDLRPGTYAVAFKLTGFSTVRRENIELTGAFVASVDGDLKVGAVEEIVSVTGDIPLVDIQRTTQQRVFDQEVIEAIPVGRSHIDLVVLIPGLSASQPGRGALADVGGTNNLQNTQFTIHGGRTSDTRLQLDGVRLGNILSFSGGEFSNFVPDTGATQEIAVDYSAITAEQAFGGIRIDIIPREGGNSLRGSIFATGVNSDWQASNLTPELEAAGLPDPNEMKHAHDVNVSVGGPIVRDTLWFYTSARWQSNQNYIAGLYNNANAGDPTQWLRVEDRSQRGYFSLEQNGINARLTWQAAPKHKVSVFYDNQARIWDDTRVGVSPESAVNYRFPRLNLAQAGWTSPMTNKLLFEGRFALRGEAFGNELPDEGSVYRSMIPVLEQSNQLFYRGKGGDGGVSGTFGYSSQKIYSAVASASYVTGSHAFKVGMSDTWGRTDSTTDSNSQYLFYRFNNGIPNQFTMYAQPSRAATLQKSELGIYGQDRWTFNRYTVNLGVRYDYYRGGYPEQYRGPVLLLPTQNYSSAAVTTQSLHDLTPRMGVAYDLFGNGKTAVKATLGKYVLALTTVGNPLGVTNFASRDWIDADSDFVVDCNLISMAAQNPTTIGGVANPAYNPAIDTCGAGPANFGQLTSVAQFDEDTRFGWGNRFYNWEFSTSVQHEIVPRVAIDVGYFRRWFGNFTVIQTIGRTAADFDQFNVIAPIDPGLPNGGGYTIEGLYNLKPAAQGAAVTSYTAFADDFGKQTEHWNGMDFSVNARVRNGVMLQGGVSTGRTTTDNCDVLANPDLGANPSLRNCHNQASFLTQVKLLGTYLLPKVDVNVAATFQSTPGIAVSANRNYTSPSSDVIWVGTNPRAFTGTTATVNLLNPGDIYGDRINQFDLRFGRSFRFGPRRVTANLDIYNVFNASPVMQENAAYAVWRTPQRIMDARLFKISAQLDF